VLTKKFPVYIKREGNFWEKINNLQSENEYLRERKKDMKLEFNNLIKDYENKTHQLTELEENHINVINDNVYLKSEITELKLTSKLII